MAILGIDEVGRGPWAGPLVVGAVVLKEKIEGLTDSKKLTPKKREELDKKIRASRAAVGLGWVGSSELDEIGLSESLKKATRAAVEKIKTPYHEIIIDGTVNFLSGTAKEKYVTVLPKADLLISEVSAASIVAKVARDTYMKNLAKTYPNHAFENHVGYGTAAHLKAIKAFGLTPEHRRSFKPIQELSEHEAKKVNLGSTKAIGDKAENKIAEYLENKGHKILARNWKKSQCEIDIVSFYDEKCYFTEVKYRKSASRGTPLEMITKRKLTKMAFAAKVYAKFNNLKNQDLILAAASVEGETYEIKDWFPISLS